MRVKAATTFSPQAGASTLILFSQPSPAFQTGSYWGPFIQLTNFDNKKEFDFNLPPQFRSVASLLLVHTMKAPEVRLSFKDEFTPRWNEFFSANMPPQVTRVGSPMLRWDPFPVNEGSLNKNNIYLSVDQDLKIDFTDFWAAYHCTISYWIHLFPDNGRLSANVARWGYGIEAGAFTAVVKEILEPNVRLGQIALDKALKAALAQFPVNDVYYLPGRQVNSTISPGKGNVFKGNTLDDVTIVLS